MVGEPEAQDVEEERLVAGTVRDHLQDVPQALGPGDELRADREANRAEEVLRPQKISWS